MNGKRNKRKSYSSDHSQTRYRLKENEPNHIMLVAVTRSGTLICLKASKCDRRRSHHFPIWIPFRLHLQAHLNIWHVNGPREVISSDIYTLQSVR
ncbi:hypothetical protein TNIN_202681 [Trichonephila inaurata madagascariensis]|uniref:Uncharacterized protein n=1 Tax=Trichonephila inaurata madagascariensis TaxID=2747483 RepID=A0A8X6WP45_9ARAC|nr:hypothetical protein TNIN_202681 [Trichonephila inaurata madagascariensis]